MVIAAGRAWSDARYMLPLSMQMLGMGADDQLMQYQRLTCNSLRQDSQTLVVPASLRTMAHAEADLVAAQLLVLSFSQVDGWAGPHMRVQSGQPGLLPWGRRRQAARQSCAGVW